MLAAYYDHAASIPAPSECYCYLMTGHPHAAVNDLCDVCKAEAETEPVAIERDYEFMVAETPEAIQYDNDYFSRRCSKRGI